MYDDEAVIRNLRRDTCAKMIRSSLLDLFNRFMIRFVCLRRSTLASSRKKYLP
jgi:hypothetical protein